MAQDDLAEIDKEMGALPEVKAQRGREAARQQAEAAERERRQREIEEIEAIQF